MTNIRDDRATWLFSAVSAQTASPAIDLRGCADYGYVFYCMSGNSGVFALQGSHDLTAWMEISKFTAEANETGTAQGVGYYPYLRATAGPMYTGTGGATSATAALWLHVSPGVK